MIVVHLIYDLTELYRLLPWEYPSGFLFVKNWGGVSFLLISGICATLGSHSLRRGCIVFGCGLLVSAVTYLTDPAMTILFGVLHCLGICMILWAAFRKLPAAALAAAGVVLAGIGFWFARIPAVNDSCYWLGLSSQKIFSPDYFPLLPNFGFFLLGAAVGKTVYRDKQTLLPGVATDNRLIRFFCLCGRHSLLIYLLHQPVLVLLLESFRVFQSFLAL